MYDHDLRHDQEALYDEFLAIWSKSTADEYLMIIEGTCGTEVVDDLINKAYESMNDHELYDLVEQLKLLGKDNKNVDTQA
jgi:hypothetical protein